MIYAKLFAFKDYSDNLYVTVSLNATGFLAGLSYGQVLLPHPLLDEFPAGLLSVSDSFLTEDFYDRAQYSTAQVGSEQ
jgi:hypothetical protein